ncbi:MAG: 50S ribosomal protein L4 [Lachnospiraceae bacterium]|nr:50S ribosomal protein L4 [Lachnospiraceae bacterium]MCR5532125.1 50S ribosomal protein L4 [Lachnospiraceae bacterium]
MANVKLYNKEGAEVGTLDLNDSIFGVEVNTHLMHLAVVSQLANKRQGTQSALTRSEVSGGGIKPWRQKGTGRARQGSIRSPQWKGGGVVFAPKPRDYSVKMNKKEKAGAIKSALTSRVAEDKIFVMEDLAFDEIKTKQVKSMLDKLSLDKALIVTADKDENVILSARNLPGVRTVTSNAINVFDILKYSNLVITKDAVAKIEEVYA